MRIIRYLASTSFDFGCTSFDYVAVASLLRLGGRLLPGSFVKAVELFLELCERCDLALHLFGPERGEGHFWDTVGPPHRGHGLGY